MACAGIVKMEPNTARGGALKRDTHPDMNLEEGHLGGYIRGHMPPLCTKAPDISSIAARFLRTMTPPTDPERLSKLVVTDSSFQLVPKMLWPSVRFNRRVDVL